MKRTLFFMRMMASMVMSLVTLVAAADEYIDPQSKVVYTYEPGSGTAMVKAGDSEIVYRNDEPPKLVYHQGSPDAAGDVAILGRFTVGTEEYVVTSIGERAFWGSRNITSVSIPETVTKIKKQAFSGCTNMTTVQLPEGLTRITWGLFGGCENLVSVVLPSTVKRIEPKAFIGCRNLVSITLPDSLLYAGLYAFEGTRWYDSMYKNAPDGSFYIGPLLLGYKGRKPTGDLVIREGTTCVGYEAFFDCKGLTSVTVPPSVAYVDYGAFYCSSSLTAVHITDLAAWCGITFKTEGGGKSSNPLCRAHHLYLNGEKVTDLVIPEGVTSIGNYAFDECADLKNVTIPDGVTSIGTSAFKNCGSMTSVTIPPSVTTIKSCAFIYCFALKAVHISDLTAWRRISFEDNTANPLRYGARLYLNDKDVTDLIDEVIDINDDNEDGTTPDIIDAQNRRIDFTHTIKTKPKAPFIGETSDAAMNREAEQSIYGEYNELQLNINLDPLVDTYLVCITDENDNVVYENIIDTGTIAGLNIDISAYANGVYTVTVENSYESFIGVFEVQVVGKENVSSKKEAVIYNLQGRPVDGTKKGIYIQNGKKVLVK